MSNPETASSSPLPDVVSVHEDFGAALNSVIRSVDAFRHRAAQDAGTGITELRALNRINLAGTLSPKQLADSLDLTTGTVTALLDRMERGDLVTRAAHPTDRRMLQIQLTPTGEDRLRRALASFEARVFAAAETMPSETVEGAAELLRRVAAEIARYSSEWRRGQGPGIS